MKGCLRKDNCQEWWHTTVIPALKKRKEVLKFKVSLGYTVRLCFEKKRKKEEN
jgi:hypothetical protein